MSDPEALIQCQATIAGESYVVLAADLQLGLSELGSLRCELSADDGAPEIASVIGQPLTFVATRADEQSLLRFAAIVIEAELVGEQGNQPFVRIEAAPRMWRLGKRVGYRVFQELSVPDVVKDVLTRAGIPESAQDWQLSESYEPRTYCLQHRESELDFVQRLLAEEGISFAIEERDGEDTVLFTDSDLGPVTGTDTLSYLERGGFHEAGDHVWDLTHHHAVRPDKVVLRDFDFERPDFRVENEQLADDGAGGNLAIYDFPARTRDEATLERFTTVMLQSSRADRERVTGLSGALHLSPGRRVSIEEHPYEPVNQELLLVKVRYRYQGTDQRRQTVAEGVQAMSFEAVPPAAPFRPPRAERGKAVPGYDTAVIVGPSGEELCTDAHGRVKAQYHWDREGQHDDSSSCFMRTTQLPLGGSLLTPRVGFEVAIACSEGDPDDPVIQGRMFNAEWPPPYALPKNKTRMTLQTGTTPGGGSVNELRMEDAAGSEEMFMNASKDMSVSAGNNATEAVVGNETRTIGSNHTLDVTGAAEASVGAAQTVNVGANQKQAATSYMVADVSGSHTHSIGGSRDVKTGGDHRQSVSADASVSVGGSQIDLVAGSVTDATLAAMTDTVGAALAELTASSRSVAVEGARSETTGAAKIVVSKGGRGTKCASMTHNVTGAVLYKTKADLNDNAEGDLLDIAGGAQIIKATNVTFAAESLLTVVCGGSTLTLTPGSVTIAGATITIDATAPEVAALVKDN
jgi:type VI secretion system secreted protein VgrG